MKNKDLGIKTYSSSEEQAARQSFFDHYKSCPIPEDQVLSNLGLFLNSKTLARLLFLDHMYQQMIDVQGVIMEFGTRWGQNLAVLSALRGIYEPFNRHRKIIGFDTFQGFPSISSKDGASDMMKQGELAVTENYEAYLTRTMELQEQDNPLGHIRKFEVRAGNATVELDAYLRQHPETIISLAYFDFYLYEPTKICLDLIKPRLVKGSILGFDELNDLDSPGETVALMETFGLNNLKLKRYRYASRVSYFVME